MRIVLCAECYSPNLGDAVIAEAMRQSLQAVAPDVTVELLDLSGRSAAPSDSPARSGRGFAGPVRALHRALSRSSPRYASLVNSLRHKIRGGAGQSGQRGALTLRRGDVLIIGGGQLVQDNRLAFVLAISSLVESARRAAVPVCFFAVGVGRAWSTRGRRLMAAALTSDNVTSIYCRDPVSVERIHQHFERVAAKTSLTVDAALALQVDGRSAQGPATGDDRPLGLGIIDPVVVNRHSPGHPCGERASAIPFWLDLHQELTARGLTVRLFTNGAAEDQRFAETVQTAIAERAGHGRRPQLAPRARTAQALVETIGGLAGIVAHRLHANVVAHVLDIPYVALGWDDKVEAFMHSVDRASWYVGPTGAPADIADRAAAAASDGASGLSARSLAPRVHADLGRALASLTRHTEG